jgi:hypothetical protein
MNNASEIQEREERRLFAGWTQRELLLDKRMGYTQKECRPIPIGVTAFLEGKTIVRIDAHTAKLIKINENHT